MRERAQRGGFFFRARAGGVRGGVLAVLRLHRVKDEGGDRRDDAAGGDEQPAGDIAAGVLALLILRHYVVFPVHFLTRSALT